MIGLLCGLQHVGEGGLVELGVGVLQHGRLVAEGGEQQLAQIRHDCGQLVVEGLVLGRLDLLGDLTEDTESGILGVGNGEAVELGVEARNDIGNWRIVVVLEGSVEAALRAVQVDGVFVGQRLDENCTIVEERVHFFAQVEELDGGQQVDAPSERSGILVDDSPDLSVELANVLEDARRGEGVLLDLHQLGVVDAVRRGDLAALGLVGLDWVVGAELEGDQQGRGADLFRDLIGS